MFRDSTLAVQFTEEKRSSPSLFLRVPGAVGDLSMLRMSWIRNLAIRSHLLLTGRACRSKPALDRRSQIVEPARLPVERALENDSILAGLGIDRLHPRLRVRGGEDHVGELVPERHRRRRSVLERLEVVH